MSTNIEWTKQVLPDGTITNGDTWNPLIGCDKVSAGCRDCYAIKTAWIRMHNPAMMEKYAGTVRKTEGGKLNWTGKVNMHAPSLSKPLKTKKPTTFFVNSMSDLWHMDVPFWFVDQVLAVIALTPRHTHQVLTKRDDRMYEYYEYLGDNPIEKIAAAAGKLFDDEAECWVANYLNGWSQPIEAPKDGNPLNGTVKRWPIPNLWVGVSVEDQPATSRIHNLMRIPAAVRFLSCEPLISELNITNKGINGGYSVPTRYTESMGRKVGIEWTDPGDAFIGVDWVICGGESGSKDARPMHPDWARSLRDQCAAAGVAFFFKQWGAWMPIDMPHTQDNIDRLEHNEQWLNLAGGMGFHGEEVYRMRNVGKKIAGRLLDGVEHNAFPVQEAAIG